jgi:hypothetical protein
MKMPYTEALAFNWFSNLAEALRIVGRWIGLIAVLLVVPPLQAVPRAQTPASNIAFVNEENTS